MNVSHFESDCQKNKHDLFTGWKAGQEILEAAQAAPQQSEYVHFVPHRVDKFNNWAADLNLELNGQCSCMERLFSCEDDLQIGAKRL
jgi:hypothetical protein